MAERILVIGEYGIRNGGENSFLSIAPLLKKLGWEFSAAIPNTAVSNTAALKTKAPSQSQFASALTEIGINTFNLSFADETGERKSQSTIREEIAKLIQKVNPALVHCNSLSTSRLCGPVTNELGIPGLGYLRDILKLSRKAISDINQLDRIIAVSEATKSWHVEYGMDQQKIHVVHNGVDSDQFRPARLEDVSSLREQLQIPANAHVLLFVGQIGIRKGVDVLIDAYLQIQQKIPNLHLLIVGERNSTKQEAIDYEKRLHDSVSNSDCASQVHWLGRRTDVAEIMRQSTLLLHPARQEPLGRVLLEALSSGLPAITTSVGGSPEIFSNSDLQELQELLVPKDNVEELVSKTISLLEDNQRRTSLGLLCREAAISKFSVEQCANRLNQLYRQIVEDYRVGNQT